MRTCRRSQFPAVVVLLGLLVAMYPTAAQALTGPPSVAITFCVGYWPGGAVLSAEADDTASGNSTIESIEVSWNQGADWVTCAPVDGTYDSPHEYVEQELPIGPNVEVWVRATDAVGSTSAPTVCTSEMYIDGMFLNLGPHSLVTSEDTALVIDAWSLVEPWVPDGYMLLGAPVLPPDPSLSGPSNGTLTSLGSGDYSYESDSGFTGTDSFTYGVTDQSYTAIYYTSTVSITVEPAEAEAGTGVSVSADAPAPTELSLTFSVTANAAPDGGSITDTVIDFATLVPNVPKSGSHTLEVLTNASNGYNVTTSEDTSLTTGAHSIPDVIGDDDSITESIAGPWESVTTLGFGYTLANVSGTSASFTSDYKQFADESAIESAQSVMEGTVPTLGDAVDLTYKVNIGPSQVQGTYSNTVTYIATGNL